MKHTRRVLIIGLALLAACNTTPSDVGEGAVDDFDVGGDRPPSVRTLHAMSRVLAAQGRDGQCELVFKTDR